MICESCGNETNTLISAGVGLLCEDCASGLGIATCEECGEEVENSHDPNDPYVLCHDCRHGRAETYRDARAASRYLREI